MCSCSQVQEAIHQQIIEEPCTYTLDIVVEWKDRLFCIRDNDLIKESGITNQKFNSYMGILLSCINSNSACFFKIQLDEIQLYINTLIICPTT